MKYFISILSILFFSITAFSQVEEGITNNKIKTGDLLEGGIVFFVDETGSHGLVCAINDQSLSATWNKRKLVRRNERLSENFNTTTTIFGSKSQNKLNNKKYNANRLCSKLKIKNNSKTYKDWFLPSKENLALMYLNRSVINETALKNGGSNFIDSYYWSSTEFDHTNAWVQSFKDGKKGYHFKNYFYSVRAIRAF